MKKMIILLFCAASVMAFTACTAKPAEQESNIPGAVKEAAEMVKNPIASDEPAPEVEEEYDEGETHGWMLAEDNSVAGTRASMFEDAKELLQHENEPVAYLAVQEPDELNHCYLTKEAKDDGSIKYRLVYVHDEHGEWVGILQADDLFDPAGGLAGGWTAVEGDAAKEGLEAFEKTSKSYSGKNLTAIQTLGSQIVAGTNYKILCKASSGPRTGFVLATVYKDLAGNCEITGIESVSIMSSVEVI